jgi:iron complex transport system permease protein
MTALSAKPIRPIVFFLCLGLIVFVTTLLSLTAGTRYLSLETILDALSNQADEETLLILWNIRMPRVALSAMVGAALGLSGGIIQSITRNPLGDPGLLGLNAGAGLAIVIGTGILGTDIVSSPFWLAAIGAGLAAFAVQGLAGYPCPIRLTLAGIAIGAFCFGLTQAIALTDPERFDLVRNWRAASLAAATPQNVINSIWMFAAGTLLVVWLAPRTGLIALGDDRALSLGVSVKWTRLVGLLAVMLLAGGATAIAGPITFIGLAAPHIARRMVHFGEGVTLTVAAFIGAELVVLADTVARTVVAPNEIPVSVVVAVLGAPFLIFMARRQKPSLSV